MAYLLTLVEENPTHVTTGDAATVTLPENANPTRGEALFTTFQAHAGFACSTCHLPNSEHRLIGPGLLNVGTRAQTRVNGMDAVTYLYTAIVDPGAYVVDGFDDGLIPKNWAQVYSTDEIYAIVAYLLTLGG